MTNSDSRHDTVHVTEGQAQEALNTATRRVTRADVDTIVQRQKELDEKLTNVPRKFLQMINQVKLLFEMIRDYWTGEFKGIPWASIAMAIGALVYFLSPVDLIPDFIPVIGYLDDAMVVALAIKAIQEDLRAYCAHKKYAIAKYFD